MIDSQSGDVAQQEYSQHGNTNDDADLSGVGLLPHRFIMSGRCGAGRTLCCCHVASGTLLVLRLWCTLLSRLVIGIAGRNGIMDLPCLVRTGAFRSGAVFRAAGSRTILSGKAFRRRLRR